MEFSTGNPNTTLPYFYSFIRETITAKDDTLERVNEKFDNWHELMDSTGENLLHYSVEYNYISTTRWLIDCGLDVNAQTVFGKTPLMIAVERKHEEIVSILLKANAKILITDREGQTVIEKLPIECFHWIKNNSLIPGAIMMKLIDKCETEEEAAVKLFNANVPFHLVIYIQSSIVIKYYLDQGIDVNVLNCDERVTALHMAIYFQDWKSVKVLLDYGADINAKDLQGRTPIMYMRECQYCKHEKLEILKLLLAQGVKLFTFNKDGYMQVYAIFHSCSREAVEQVLKVSKVDLHSVDRRNNTLLHYLAGNNNPGVFELAQSQIINLDLSKYFGYTLLEAAASNCVRNTMQYLLDHGADVNGDKKNERNLLFSALMGSIGSSESLECLEILLQYGVDPQTIKNNGLTIFCLAKKMQLFDLIQPVLAHVALLEATGVIVKKEIRANIDSVVRFKNSFNAYKPQLEQLKKIVICKSVTMFQLLSMSEKELLFYLKNENIISKLEQFSYYKNNQGVYYRKLRLRIACVCRKEQLKVHTIEALYKIMRMSYDNYPTIINKICSYLSKHDLIQLGRI